MIKHNGVVIFKSAELLVLYGAMLSHWKAERETDARKFT